MRYEKTEEERNRQRRKAAISDSLSRSRVEDAEELAADKVYLNSTAKELIRLHENGRLNNTDIYRILQVIRILETEGDLFDKNLEELRSILVIKGWMPRESVSTISGGRRSRRKRLTRHLTRRRTSKHIKRRK
jgi:hypothetical protein